MLPGAEKQFAWISGPTRGHRAGSTPRQPAFCIHGCCLKLAKPAATLQGGYGTRLENAVLTGSIGLMSAVIWAVAIQFEMDGGTSGKTGSAPAFPFQAQHHRHRSTTPGPLQRQNSELVTGIQLSWLHYR